MNGHQAYQKIQRSKDEWRALLDRYRCSGLRISAFCRQEKISPASFYRWRNTLAGDDIEPSTGTHAHSSQNSAGFIDLGSLTPSFAGNRLDIRLELGGGVVLHLVRN